MRRTEKVIDADDRENVHNTLVELIDEIEEEWFGPVMVTVRHWDRYRP